MPQQMLITEALQQVKIILDRIDKKEAVITTYVAHNSRFSDPMQKQGGSQAIITAEFQAIEILSSNLINIRTAIAKKNLETMLTVGGLTQSVAEWIIWKRELCNKELNFLNILGRTIVQKRTLLEAEQAKVATSNSPEAVQIKEANLVVNVDERMLAEQAEDLAVIIGTLDGKLSVINATVSIKIPD